MSQSGQSTSKSNERPDYALGLIISVLINLASTWFQQYLLSNIALLIVVAALLFSIFVYSIKHQVKILFIALANYVIFVFLDVFSSYLQVSVLQNSNSVYIVLAIVVSPLLGLMLSAKLKPSHPQSMNVQAVNLFAESKPTKPLQISDRIRKALELERQRRRDEREQAKRERQQAKQRERKQDEWKREQAKRDERDQAEWIKRREREQTEWERRQIKRREREQAEWECRQAKQQKPPRWFDSWW